MEVRREPARAVVARQVACTVVVVDVGGEEAVESRLRRPLARLGQRGVDVGRVRQAVGVDAARHAQRAWCLHRWVPTVVAPRLRKRGEHLEGRSGVGGERVGRDGVRRSRAHERDAGILECCGDLVVAQTAGDAEVGGAVHLRRADLAGEAGDCLGGVAVADHEPAVEPLVQRPQASGEEVTPVAARRAPERRIDEEDRNYFVAGVDRGAQHRVVREPQIAPEPRDRS